MEKFSKKNKHTVSVIREARVDSLSTKSCIDRDSFGSGDLRCRLLLLVEGHGRTLKHLSPFLDKCCSPTALSITVFIDIFDRELIEQLLKVTLFFWRIFRHLVFFG